MTLDKTLNFLFSIYFFWPLLALSTVVLMRMTPIGKALRKTNKKNVKPKVQKKKED